MNGFDEEPVRSNKYDPVGGARLDGSDTGSDVEEESPWVEKAAEANNIEEEVEDLHKREEVHTSTASTRIFLHSHLAPAL